MCFGTAVLMRKANSLNRFSIRGVTIQVPFDSIRFRLLPFGFDYFDSIMQNINDF